MKAVHVVTAAFAVVVGARAGGQTPAMSDVQALRLTVSVKSGSRAVTGLTAQDFALTDNETAQEVELLNRETVPADVTLIMSAGGTVTSASGRLEMVQQMARLLRKGDAVRPLEIATSVHDALVAALVRPVPSDRLHLVVAMTDAIDTMSVTTADRVRDVASRSDAVLQIVTARPPNTTSSPAFRRPRYRDENVLILTEAAERTGGELVGRGLFADADPVSAFKKIYDDFRQSYLLRYVPKGVELAGWHELAVSVPHMPNATVRTRHGYYAH